MARAHRPRKPNRPRRHKYQFSQKEPQHKFLRFSTILSRFLWPLLLVMVKDPSDVEEMVKQVVILVIRLFDPTFK